MVSRLGMLAARLRSMGRYTAGIARWTRLGMVTGAAMTTHHDEEKLREVADQHSADDPAVYAHLYADADYLTQIRKAMSTAMRWPDDA